MKKQITDQGYIFTAGSFTIEVYVEINQVWFWKIGNTTGRFDSAQQALDFINAQ